MSWKPRTIFELLTTKGDITVHDGDDPVRLPVGSDDEVLTADSAESSGVKWAAAASGGGTSLTTKGDLHGYDTGDARIPVGSDGQVLTADSAQALGVKWAAGGGGSGAKSYVTEPPLYPPDSADADDDEFTDTNGTDPTTTGWSWSNQSGATAEIRGGRLRMDATGVSASGIHALCKAFPASGDVTIDARVGHNAITANHSMGVLFLWGTLASPTQIEHVRLMHNNQVFWTSPGVTNRGSFSIGERPLYVRLEWKTTGTTTRGLWSVSPMAAGDFRQLAAASNVSSGSRPDFYGVAIGTESSLSNLHTAWADFFRVNWTPDFDASTDV